MPYLDSTAPSIIIVGGGIGGLTTALHLLAHGFKNIQIFEASSTLKTLGVGINVQPSAVLILRDLGLLPALESTAIKTMDLNFYNMFGQPILSEPRGVNAGYTVPQCSIHRGEFQQLLLDTVRERLGTDRIHLGHAFVGSEQDEAAGTITAHFVKRSSNLPAEIPEQTADLLIAADGINSTVRSILYPNEGPPHFSGLMLWRGCTEIDPYLTGASMIWAGHADKKFIAYPISARSAKKGRSMVNWICEYRVRKEGDPDRTPPPSNWLTTVTADKFLPEFKGWVIDGVDVEKIVNQSDKLYEFPMCDRDPVDRWTFGRLTLLGDAAHPMYPVGSNGASQAILDAQALTTALLANLSDFPAALKAYEEVRLPATAKIVLQNRAGGPDHVMQLLHERAPEGFKNVLDVISQEELDAVGINYKRVAGFDMANVNVKAAASEGTAERLGLKSPKVWTSVKGASTL